MNKQHEKEVMILVRKIKNYFDVDTIGSYNLYKAKLLPFEMINNVDFAFSMPRMRTINSIWSKVKIFLRDEGFHCSEAKDDSVDKYGNLFDTHDSLIFTKKDIVFNLRKLDDPKVLDVDEIIKMKFKRMSETDRNQLKYVIMAKKK